jgi:acyl-CoA synthetase (AMP-forming)/AMP-acid ligase II
MALHIADCWEQIADRVPMEPAIVQGSRTVPWSQYDDEAARLATRFERAELGPGRHVGIFLYNCPEYLVTQYATFKHGTVGVNVNYRYLDDELVYLLDNADVTALVYHASLADRVARVSERLPRLELLIEVDDIGGDGGAGERVEGAEAFHELVRACAPQERRAARSPDDLYLLYTGGTTGMPKGVMYKVGDFTRSLASSAATTLGATLWETAGEIADNVARAAEAGALGRTCPATPLMHATGAWIGAFLPQMTGGCSVLLRSRTLDPDEMIGLAEHGLSMLVIVGDAFARPLLQRLDERRAVGDPADLSKLGVLLSSGAMLSADVKEGLIDHAPGLVILDALGSSEGTMGSMVSTGKGSGTTARFRMFPGTKVFGDDGREVEPGSGQVGMVATTGDFLPLGYYKDPVQSARTFREVDGVRYSFPGDMATIADDGSVELLGRRSNCINTGGEKVYPEEVEEAIKTHGAVTDCLVFGLADDRFGQVVTAVVSTSSAVDPRELIDHCKARLAGYKSPRRIHLVELVPRAANGKADYPAARAMMPTS